ncbi:MAG: DNA repair protein RecN, partial [Kiritimatiellae bacterium]|nr:DNA repair protein RecN [Kiritimatiellia bacterium]
MLDFLKVRNLAIVENAQVAFSGGLNIITGETGSGKSVLIGALDLVLGERADRGAVRAGEKELAVEAAFSLGASAAIDAILDEAGLPPCEDGTLLVRRTVAASGTGKCWLNDSPTTVATLRRVGAHLIDMHGPYDHQSLLVPAFQLSLLDAFGETAREKSEYSKRFAAHAALRAERDELLSESGDGLEEEIDRLNFIAGEIDGAALTDDDGDALVERHKEACNAQAIIEDGNAILGALSEGDDSVFDRLATLQQKLGELRRIFPEAGEWHDEAASIAISVQELARTVADRMSRVETDPEAVATLEARMELVQRLKRKYGQTIDAILAKGADAKERLERLLSRGRRLAALDGEIAAAAAALEKAGAALRAVRAKAAKRLAAGITAELKPLGFARSAFEVTVKPCAPAPSGMDDVVFSFAPNPGEPSMPLADIASSGEIARVMLAVKSVLAEHDSIPVLVFDEIDSNIGGETGRAVGEKLRRLAATHQVISITHLPQVAAFGDAHFAVSKHVEGKRTLAEIQPLEGEPRALELARMLGGSDITGVVLAHARELLSASRAPAGTG